MHRRWVSKYWRKLSRHRAFIQVNVDLGMPEYKAIEAYFEAEARKKEKAKHGIHALRDGKARRDPVQLRLFDGVRVQQGDDA